MSTKYSVVVLERSFSAQMREHGDAEGKVGGIACTDGLQYRRTQATPCAAPCAVHQHESRENIAPGNISLTNKKFKLLFKNLYTYVHHMNANTKKKKTSFFNKEHFIPFSLLAHKL